MSKLSIDKLFIVLQSPFEVMVGDLVVFSSMAFRLVPKVFKPVDMSRTLFEKVQDGHFTSSLSPRLPLRCPPI